jgi:branched-chain amino acid transport system substrate-binding protein
MLKTIIFILILPFFSLFPQQDYETRFNLALNYYDTQQYEKALEYFNNLSSEEPNDFSTISNLFAGKSLLKLSRYQEAADLLNNFIDRYKDSRYKDEAHLNLANALLGQGKHFETVKELMLLAQSTDEDHYRSEALAGIENISLSNLSLPVIKELNELWAPPAIEQEMKLIIAKANIRDGNFNEALTLLNSISTSEQEFNLEIDSLRLLMPQDGNEGNMLIALLAPFSGNLSSELLIAALDVVEGIKFAFSEHNRNNPDKIGLIIRDTKSNRESIKNLRSELHTNFNIKAILGPVFSSEVRDAVQEFAGSNLPMISPTATDNDLIQLNEYFFQANPPFGIRGNIIAQYIYYVENKRRIGVLNSIDGYSPLLAAVFKEEFESLGGTITASQSYKSNSFNLSNPIRELSSAGRDMEGIYLPLADKADAPVILSQLLQSNLNLTLYGNQDWMNASGFEASSELSNKLTFTSDHFIDYDDPEYQRFSREFFARTKIAANRSVLYGYDAAKYLIEIIKKGNTQRETIKSAMESGLIIEGFHNNISFDTRRMNTFLNIIRYRNGKFELIDKFKCSKSD